MNCRLYYAEIYDIKFSGGFFNHQREPVRRLLESFGFKPLDDAGSAYECDYNDFCRAVERIRRGYLRKRNEPHPMIKYYTHGDVLEILDEIILNHDTRNDFIRLEWRKEGGYSWD